MVPPVVPLSTTRNAFRSTSTLWPWATP